MSNEWAHVAARKGVPTEMTNIILGSRVLTHGLVLADSGGACPRAGVPAQLVPDRGVVTAARTTTCTAEKSAQLQTTLQKYPFMTRGTAISGASSGPHRAWDPV
jgi:hypothetical protein